MVRIWCADDAKHSKLVEFWFHFFTRLECSFFTISDESILLRSKETLLDCNWQLRLFAVIPISRTIRHMNNKKHHGSRIVRVTLGTVIEI